MAQQHRDSGSNSLLVLGIIWLLGAISDRLWFALDRSVPAWDQADYLTNSLKYLQALQHPQWFSGEWWTNFWLLSTKIPPLAYILTVPFLQVFGTGGDRATLVHLLFSAILLASVYSLGVQLFNRQVGLWAAAICVLLPGLYRFRLQFLLDYPLTAAITFAFYCLTMWKASEGRRKKEEGREIKEDFPNSPDLPLSPSPTLPLSLDRALPWDHLDTGIDKNWLKIDLQKALEAATVPDCSFEGCSRCGVCGTDFGHNVVVDALPIPEFAGEFVPNTERKQRLRVWFGKVGDMALVGHLDLIRLFDRVIRRADLPISFTGGFHPNPRISLANALPLGVTSTGEIADFELTESIDVESFRSKLAAKLPENIPIYKVEPIDLKAPSASQLLEAAEYVITVADAGSLARDGELGLENSAAVSVADEANWEDWVKTIAQTKAFWRVHTTKSGKTQNVNLRDRLHKLELVERKSESSTRASGRTSEGIAILRYTGTCRSDGNLLKPEHIVFMLEQVSQQEIQLLQVERSQLILGYG